jgi:hypothetical protein
MLATMVTLPTIPQILRVTVRGTTADGTRWENVLHLKKGTGDPSPSDYAALVTELNRLYGGTSYGGGGAALLSACNTLTVVNDYTFTSLAAPIASVVLAASAAGPGTGNSLPAEVAEVLSLRTANRGKRYRGRIYLPPMTVTNLAASGNLASSLATSLPAQAAGFQTAIQALTTPYAWHVASYGLPHTLKNGTIATWAPFTTLITSWSFDLLPDVQRRRKS